MCLDVITRNIKNPTSIPVKAWKVFYIDKKFNLRGWYNTRLNVKDKWLISTNGALRCEAGAGEHYERGFHVCRTRKDCFMLIGYGLHDRLPEELWDGTMILPVMISKITTRGRQHGADCMVAKEMFIDSKVVIPLIKKELDRQKKQKGKK